MSQKGVRAAGLVLRIPLGVCLVFHGAPKVIDLFGSHDTGWVDRVASLGLSPAVPAAAAIATGEVLAGLAMVLGVFPRVAGSVIVAIMLGAIWAVTGERGYSIHNAGYEYNVALIAMAIAVMLIGPGAYAFRLQKAD
jgi:putative oxidoreductase